MGENRKVYAVIIIIQLIYTGLYVISKAALDEGLSTFTFIFYRQLTAAIFLVPIAFFSRERRSISSLTFCLCMKTFMHALLGITFGLNVYNVGLKYTSATVASATTNSIPVITFFLALLMKMENLKFRSQSGISKTLGVGLCLGGILTIALYTGPQLNPLTKHFGHKTNAANASPHSKETWIKGILLMISANTAWSLWMVFQGWLLEEYHSKILFTAIESVFSAVQSFVAAVAFERDFLRWKLRLDMGLLAIAYCGFVVTGVSFYLQSWCIEKKGPVFLAMSTPLALVFTILCSSLFLGEVIPMGSVLGGILMVGGLYSVVWGKSKENIESNSSKEGIKVCNQNNEGASAHGHV